MLIFFVAVLQTNKLYIHLLITLEKTHSYYLDLIFIKHTYVKGLYFSKIAGFFPATFAKINTVTGIFQGFFLDFKQYSIVSNISRRFSNGRFRKFSDVFSVTNNHLVVQT